MGQLAITNIINISVSQTNLGVNKYNTSNLGLFTDEVPAGSFGTAGFKSYVDPIDVATDFGTASKTNQMALAIFSQQPNILAGNGQLVVILLGVAVQQLAFSAVSASGAFVIRYSGNNTASLPFSASAGVIQSALRLLPGLAGVSVTGSIASQNLLISMGGVYGAAPGAFTIPTNTLMSSVPAAIVVTVTTPTAGETIGDAITRTSSLVQYFGIIVDETIAQIGQTDVLAAAAVVQALNKMAFWVSYQEADIQPSGTIDLFATGTLSHSRGLYYGDSSVASGYAGLNAMLFAAAYAGRGLSVDFTGSNTTITLNLKQLSTIQPDSSMTQTIYNEAKASGADIYPSIQGSPGILCNGANDYFDNVYNLEAYAGDLTVGLFNYLAQTATKLPQTETSMDGFKGAARNVCQQYVVNQFLAPGTWTNPTTFGIQSALLANVLQFGFYIYSQPIAQQSQEDRLARKAPLMQIAIKYAGAIQQGSVLVYVNA